MLDQLTDRPMDGLTAIKAAFGVAYLATKNRFVSQSKIRYLVFKTRFASLNSNFERRRCTSKGLALDETHLPRELPIA